MSDKLFRELDEEFEHYLDTIQFEAVEKDLTPQLKAQRRKLADADDDEYCKIYFPQIFTDVFNPIHIYIKSLVQGFHTISGCRRFGKSAYGYVTRLVKPMCIGGIGLRGLGLRTQDLAEARTASLVRLIRRNKKLMYDYDINIQQDRQGDYIINYKNLKAFGYREGIRNIFDEEFNRFECIIVDDLFDRNSVKSETDNNKVYDFVTSECTGQLKPGGLLIWFFNYVAHNSPGKKYAEEHPETHFNLPALNEAGETNWPGSYWTTQKLKELEASIPFDVWMGDYMNDPLEKGDILNIDWLSTININYIKIIASLTGVDPAHGQSPAACDKAAVTLGIEEDLEHCHITDIYIRKEGFPEFFDYLYEVRKNSKNHKAITWENDFQQWDYAAAYYTAWTRKTKQTLPLILFESKDQKTEFYGSDKESRIMNLVFPFQKGKIKISALITGTKDYKLWRAQYISFGKQKTRVDGLDATAQAYIMLPRYVSTGSFKSLGSRSFKDEDSSWTRNR
jgi:hypothetical protein